MTLEIELSPDLEHQLVLAAERSGIVPKTYALHLLQKALYQETIVTGFSLPQDEAQLLQRINRSLSEEEWQRYQALKTKRDAEILSMVEQQELISFSDRLETLNVERIQSLGELARIRQTTVTALMENLGLASQTHA